MYYLDRNWLINWPLGKKQEKPLKNDKKSEIP